MVLPKVSNETSAEVFQVELRRIIQDKTGTHIRDYYHGLVMIPF